MPAHRVQHLSDASVDTHGRAIHFSLVVADNVPIPFVMGYGPSTQVIGILGRMFLMLQETAERDRSKIDAIVAEQVSRAHIQQDPLSGNVIVQMTTPAGIPHNFVLTPKAASDIADLLKIESAKPYQVGSA